jgi:cyclopropane-fatty-acyl-phospholipid synthase
MNPGLKLLAPVQANGKNLDTADASPPSRPPSKRLAFYQWLIRTLLPKVTTPIRIVIWNGDELATAPGEPIATVRVGDRNTFVQMLLNPDLEFGEAYCDGRVVVEGDFLKFLEVMFRAPRPPAAIKFLRRCVGGWSARPRVNSLGKARDNIWHHYDIGNDFYRLWLDEQMVYTCAYFPTPTATLEEAQVAKMEHVCRKLWLKPGETVVEAGCGWGSLARHMAKHHGVKVKAYNLSHEQIAYARERARAEGLDHLVEYVEADYRTITGQYDVFVSVGMLEHVGLPHYHRLGGLIHRCLKPTGRGLIHSIGRNRPCRTNPWLEKHIFPGAYMPSLTEMMRVFEPWDFSVLDVENLRQHYAKTLEHWLERFECVSGKVRNMFDERFVQMWRLYLCSSLAGFSSGSFQLFQVTFAPARSNEIPWTRSQIYEKAGAIGQGPHHNGFSNGVVNGHGAL